MMQLWVHVRHCCGVEDFGKGSNKGDQTWLEACRLLGFVQQHVSAIQAPKNRADMVDKVGWWRDSDVSTGAATPSTACVACAVYVKNRLPCDH